MIFRKLFSRENSRADLSLNELGSENPQKVIKAAMAAGKSRNRQALSALVENLHNIDEKVRCAAAEALGDIANEQDTIIVDELIACLDDSSEEVRFTAALAVGKTGSETALAPLIRSLKSDSNPFVRDNAAKALENFNYEESLSALVWALTDTNEMVRSTAAVSLNEIILPGLINPVVSTAILPLIHAIKVVDHKGRQSIAESLGKIGDTRAIKHLQRLLEDNKQAVSSAAQEAINNINALVEYEKLKQDCLS